MSSEINLLKVRIKKGRHWLLANWPKDNTQEVRWLKHLTFYESLVDEVSCLGVDEADCWKFEAVDDLDTQQAMKLLK